MFIQLDSISRFKSVGKFLNGFLSDQNIVWSTEKIPFPIFLLFWIEFEPHVVTVDASFIKISSPGELRKIELEISALPPALIPQLPQPIIVTFCIFIPEYMDGIKIPIIFLFCPFKIE